MKRTQESAVWVGMLCWLFASPLYAAPRPAKAGQPKTPSTSTTTRPGKKKSKKRITPQTLNTKQATRFASISLHCATREFPYKLGQVLAGKSDLKSPRSLHPAFYGCFDWHSAVHGHWAMVRLLKKFPRMSIAAKVRALLQQHLTLTNMKKEAAFFRSKFHKTFERPYGWGWYLRLVGELHNWKDKQGKEWRKALVPLEALLVQRTQAYLKKLSVPVRAGTHASTAFALVHILDYAEATKNFGLRASIHKAALRYFGKDKRCPVQYEPSGEDFISPCLAEADLMRRVLPASKFASWLSSFLPFSNRLAMKSVMEPPQILDRKDYKIGHLIGLLLHRSWAMQGLAADLPPRDPRRSSFKRSAALHLQSALRQMFDSGYGGTHWLASFAIYTLTQVGVKKP